MAGFDTAGAMAGSATVEFDYVIVLDVVDSNGMEATDSVTIHVGERTRAVYLPVVLKRR